MSRFPTLNTAKTLLLIVAMAVALLVQNIRADAGDPARTMADGTCQHCIQAVLHRLAG